MSLITVVIVLIIIGFLLYLLETKIPMDSTIKSIIYFVIILAVILWLLNIFGVVGTAQSNSLRI
jgi:hypothetical protein